MLSGLPRMTPEMQYKLDNFLPSLFSFLIPVIVIAVLVMVVIFHFRVYMIIKYEYEKRYKK